MRNTIATTAGIISGSKDQTLESSIEIEEPRVFVPLYYDGWYVNRTTPHNCADAYVVVTDGVSDHRPSSPYRF
jgi:hypothetical protein